MHRTSHNDACTSGVEKQHHRRHTKSKEARAKTIRLKTVRDVTQVVRGILGIQGGGGAGVHPGNLPGGEARAPTLGVSQGIVRDRPFGGIDPRLRYKPSISTSEFTSGPSTEACIAITGIKLWPPRADPT